MNGPHVDHPRVPVEPLPTLMSDADLALVLGAPSLSADDISASRTATALIQSYTDRQLILADYSETHYSRSDGSIQLLEYPVRSITSIESLSAGAPMPLSNYRLVRPTGVLLGVWGCEIAVEYSAGFDVLPADLRAAFLAVFGAVRIAQTQIKDGPIKKVSVVGVGSVEYDLGDSTSAMASPWGVMPASAIAALAPYRNHGPCGVG